MEYIDTISSDRTEKCKNKLYSAAKAAVTKKQKNLIDKVLKLFISPIEEKQFLNVVVNNLEKEINLNLDICQLSAMKL